MSKARVLAAFLLALYMLAAGALPVADAMLERAGAASLSAGAGGPAAPDSPGHDDTCPICTFLDRFPAMAAGGAAGHATAASGEAGRVHFADSTPSQAASRALHPARAPPFVA